MFCLQLLEDWRANQTLLTLPYIIFGLCHDEWLIHELHGLSIRDLDGHILHQALGHVLEHYRLQRERRVTGSVGPLHQRTPAQRLDGFQECSADDAWAQVGDKVGKGYWLAFHGEYSQNLLLERRAALDLLGKQKPNATEDSSRPRLFQKRAYVTAEHLTDALADYLQGEAIPAEPANQIGPIRQVPESCL